MISELHGNSKSFRMCWRKTPYTNEMQAAAAAGRQQFYHPDTKLRYYKCYLCDSWHLTHTERK